MILGSTTVYKCDGADCETTRVVPIEIEAEFEQEWHVGLTSHFCGTCKSKFENAAAILRDELAIEKLVRRGPFGKRALMEVPHAA